MAWEAWRQPYYLSKEAQAEARGKLEQDLAGLGEFADQELTPSQSIQVTIATHSVKWAVGHGELTSEQAGVHEAIAQRLESVGLALGE